MSYQLTPERLTSLLLVAWTELVDVHDATQELAMLIEAKADPTTMLAVVRKIGRHSELPLPIVRLVGLLNDRTESVNGSG